MATAGSACRSSCFRRRPPRARRRLFRHLDELMAFAPSFVTCTYGAGGSTRHKTLEVVSEVRRRYGCTVASHLTCVGSTVDQLRSYLAEACRARRGKHRRIAGRSAEGGRDIPSRRRRILLCQRACGADPRRVSAIRNRRGRLSGNASGGDQRRGRSGESQAKSRCRRNRRHHAVVLRQRRFVAVSRPLPPAWVLPRRSCRAFCRLRISHKSGGSRRFAERGCRANSSPRSSEPRAMRSNSKWASNSRFAKCGN